jgi:hypothetical protein
MVSFRSQVKGSLIIAVNCDVGTSESYVPLHPRPEGIKAIPHECLTSTFTLSLGLEDIDQTFGHGFVVAGGDFHDS